MIDIKGLDINVFSDIVKEAVKYYPELTSDKCKTPQAYAFVDKVTDIDADNLGKNLKDKRFYYSRRWAKQGQRASHIAKEVPLVILHAVSFTVDDPFNVRKRVIHSIELMVLDDYSNDMTKSPQNCPYCEGRTIELVMKDTRDIMHNILNYVASTVCFVKGSEIVWTHKDRRIQLPQHTIDEVVTDAFHHDIKEFNRNAFGEILDMSIGSYRGSLINLRIPETQCKDDIIFNFFDKEETKPDSTY